LPRRIGPLSTLNHTFQVQLHSFTETSFADFDQVTAAYYNPMPLRYFAPFFGDFVFPIGICCNGKGADFITVFKLAKLRVCTKVSDKNDLIYARRHDFPFRQILSVPAQTPVEAVNLCWLIFCARQKF